jgi:hypothetical protein
VAVADERLGYETKPGGLYGFYGKRCRHALYGDKEDRRLIQMTGSAASNAFALCDYAQSCSRIDVQITIRMECGSVDAMMLYLLASALDAPTRRGKPVSVSSVFDRESCQTIYIGKRSSDIFLRIYNKFAESGKEEYRDCVRFEVELKGKAAQQLWDYSASNDVGTMHALQVLIGLFARRGINIKEYTSLIEPVDFAPRERSAADVTMAWYRRQVAPSLKKFSAKNGLAPAIDMIFSATLTSLELDAMIDDVDFVGSCEARIEEYSKLWRQESYSLTAGHLRLKWPSVQTCGETA